MNVKYEGWESIHGSYTKGSGTYIAIVKKSHVQNLNHDILYIVGLYYGIGP